MNSTLPLLPGYTFSSHIGQERFHRTKFFDFKQGSQYYDPSRHLQTHGGIYGVSNTGAASANSFYSPLKKTGVNSPSSASKAAFRTPQELAEIERNRSRSALGHTSMIEERDAQIPSRASTSLGFSALKDKSEAVRFRAFFHEDLPDQVSQEPYRIHDCVVSCFLQDNGFTICERASKNSGLWPGVILRRQPVLSDDGNHKYLWENLRVGDELLIFGRHYRLIDCDERSRNKYLEMLQVVQPPPIALPTDPYHNRIMTELQFSHAQQQAKDTVAAKRAQKQNEVLTRFRNFDRQVLRFYCVWDDTRSQFGDRRFFILHLYLTDMTIEIKEVTSKNSGRESGGVFLARGLLPKNAKTPERSDQISEDDCYKDNNLRIGKTINVFGKPFFIYDCDEFTRKYYATFYGLQDFTPVDVTTATPKAPVAPTPRHNGFGQELDTYQNTKRLLPRRLQPDLKRWREFSGSALRFEAKWEDAVDYFDKNRVFVVTFFLADGTCAIFESTGMGPGARKATVPSKFLQRTRLKKPDSNSSVPEYYSHEDLFVGARLKVYGRTFCLTNMDQHSMKLLRKIGEYQKSEEEEKNGNGNDFSYFSDEKDRFAASLDAANHIADVRQRHGSPLLPKPSIEVLGNNNYDDLRASLEEHRAGMDRIVVNSRPNSNA